MNVKISKDTEYQLEYAVLDIMELKKRVAGIIPERKIDRGHGLRRRLAGSIGRRKILYG